MFTRVLTAIPALVVALAALGGPQGLGYRCAMDGEVRSSCCCAHDRGEPTHELRRTRASCCDIEAAHWNQTPPALEAGRGLDLPVAAPAVAVLLNIAPAPRSRVAALPPSARAPPDAGPPLYITHCAFLI